MTNTEDTCEHRSEKLHIDEVPFPDEIISAPCPTGKTPARTDSNCFNTAASKRVFDHVSESCECHSGTEGVRYRNKKHRN